MKGDRALRLAADLARRARDDAAVRLADAQRQQQHAESQQQQLQAYAGESTRQWFERARQSVAVGLLQQHGQFMAKLDHAIVFQGDVIAQQQRRVAAQRQGLVAADQKLKRFEHMLAARQALAAQRVGRLEQQQTDELAAQAHLRLRREQGADGPFGD